ncbi:molybdopterin molybdotransferase MoeA [Sphingomonas sp. ID1715]|uniref:molybdopterin molybdotransferase MoeA n=1 Tax=Sphingomonas sp. ID1715 TaxID=1656898 RepID=UPI0014879D12|nr:molybdopterin molybdotransferase MoeA [Sphingomonas sp. ID1715]NNM76553.1 molybdopterin molybdotransferase MoeA [Sphingomonas sp. ID1715]
MIRFDEAVRLVAAAAQPLGSETIKLDEAHGRVLAAPVIARVSSPWADVSTMDGYAVHEADLGVSALRVIGQSFPGNGFDGSIAAGEAVRIFTGAPVPAGADRVIIQENVQREDDRLRVLEVGSGTNIRRAGSDFVEGAVLLEPGTVLNPRALVAAAAADVAEVTVHRRPRLRLIATGDELAEPGSARDRFGAIPESISVGVAALASEWGAEPMGKTRLSDDLAAMRTHAQAACGDADLVVVTGGASVGERDFAKAMFGDTLDLIFSKVAIKPGKPVWLGRMGAALVMGLPGNPTSAMVTARLLLAPLIAGMTGRDPAEALRWRPLPLPHALGPAGDRETFSRAALEAGALRLLPNQDSGAQKTLVTADLLVRRPAGDSGLTAGAPVQVLDF